jgi:hypothetical protein
MAFLSKLFSGRSSTKGKVEDKSTASDLSSTKQDEDWVLMSDREANGLYFDNGPPELTQDGLVHQKW